MIDHCARAEALADALLETVRAEKGAPPDEFDIVALSVMTILSLNGDNRNTLDGIAAELRRIFVLKEISK